MSSEIIQKVFIESAYKYKDKIAFHYFDQKWETITYDELLNYVKSIASYLITSEIKKDDRIAILSENRPEWCMAYLAISLSGSIAVPIDVQLSPDEIKNLLADSKSKAFFHSSKTEENVKKAVQALDIDTSGIIEINFDSPQFKDISETPEVGRYPETSPEDLASIIYTSGTTGTPKGVMLTHRNFCADARALIEAGILSENDSVLGVLPLHHTYPFLGNLLIPLFLGISITYPQSLKGPDLMAAMKDKGITILVSVPQLLELIRNGILNKIKKLPGPFPKIMLRILRMCGSFRQNFNINLGKFIFKSVHKALGTQFRFFACGGAKLDPQIMKDLEALGLTVLEGYGLTETSPVVTFNPIEKRKPDSVGKSLPSAHIRIIDPEKQKEELGVMQEGEVVIKGPMVMKGYYKDPLATEQVLKDGWFYSGDLGYLDEDGYLFITGRLKEVIVLSSGKSIYPDEVEKKYLGIPLIKEICVLGREEKGMVESLHAVIVPNFEYAKEEKIGNLQEALKWEINTVSSRLPQYMRIKGFSLYPEPLPRTPLGKLRRFMMKDIIEGRSLEFSIRKEEDTSLTGDEIGRRVVECLKPLLKEPFPVQAKDSLELDLGLDSLAKIELVVALEKAFSLKLPETFVSEIQTVEELIKKIKEYGAGEVSEAEKMPMWKDILKTEPDIDDRKKVGLHHGSLEWLLIFIGFSLMKIILKICFRLQVKGLENLPGSSPHIIAPNHVSYLDGFAVAGAIPSRSFRDFFSLGLQQFFTGKIRGTFARLAHVIPIDPETYLNKALQMSTFILRNKKSLLIFPEGGRSYDGELMEFKKGIGILALELNVPVIPTYIAGSFQALPRGAKWPKFTGITITFGKPLYPSDIKLTERLDTVDEYQSFTDELKKKVEGLKDLK